MPRRRWKRPAPSRLPMARCCACWAWGRSNWEQAAGGRLLREGGRGRVRRILGERIVGTGQAHGGDPTRPRGRNACGGQHAGHRRARTAAATAAVTPVQVSGIDTAPHNHRRGGVVLVMQARPVIDPAWFFIGPGLEGGGAADSIGGNAALTSPSRGADRNGG